MPPDDIRTHYVRYDACPGCQIYVTCEVNGVLVWERTYRGSGTDVIPIDRPGYTVRLKVTCMQDPTSQIECPPRCVATVKIGNPVNFQCP